MRLQSALQYPKPRVRLYVAVTSLLLLSLTFLVHSSASRRRRIASITGPVDGFESGPVESAIGWSTGVAKEVSVNDNLSTAGGSEEAGESGSSELEGSLVPLERVYTAFQAGNATLFLLRIAKAASSVLDEIFSTMEYHEECQPNMRTLEGPQCDRLFSLLHYGWVEDSCQGRDAWDDPVWQDLDCLTWIYSYGYEASYHQLPDPELRTRLQRTFQHARLVSGHFQFGLHRIGHRGTFAYVTSLRDPVSRVISYWNYHLDRQLEAAPDETFDSFLDRGDLAFGGFEKSNHMVRVLCNEGTGLRDQPNVWFSDDTPLDQFAEITREQFDCALRNLRTHFALVFVAERIDELFQLAPSIKRLFNMKASIEVEPSKINPTYVNENRERIERGTLPSKIRAKLRALNSWDILLYKEACQLHTISVARLKKLQGRTGN